MEVSTVIISCILIMVIITDSHLAEYCHMSTIIIVHLLYNIYSTNIFDSQIEITF